MRALLRILDGISSALLAIGCVAILAMMIQVMVDVVLRNVFKLSVPGTEEIVSAYYMVAVAFLPLAFVQRERGHVMIELFTQNLPPRVNAVLDGIVFLACGIGLAIFTYAGTVKAIAMTEQSEILIGTIDVTVWPSRWFLAAGCGAMTLYLLLHSVQELAWGLSGSTLGKHGSPEHVEEAEQI